MNIENINKTIAIMERAKERDSVYMQVFQVPKDGVRVHTEAELNACGTTACLAGHIAISPEWLKIPGNMSGASGHPVTRNTLYPEEAIATWWCVSVKVVDCFIHGDSTSLSTELGIYPVDWDRVKAEHVIEQLTLLRDLGEVEYCKLKGISI